MTVEAASMSLGTHYPKEICGWSLNQLGKMGKKQSRQYKIFMQRGERTDQNAPACIEELHYLKLENGILSGIYLHVLSIQIP